MREDIQAVIDGLRAFQAKYDTVLSALASATAQLEAINASTATAEAERDKLSAELAQLGAAKAEAQHQLELSNYDAAIRHRELVDQCDALGTRC
jgi:hypothetical protein